jgi:hypothetical protein
VNIDEVKTYKVHLSGLSLDQLREEALAVIGQKNALLMQLVRNECFMRESEQVFTNAYRDSFK